jgi:sulfite oxidase
MISRRNFIKGVSTAAVAAASIRPLLSWADDSPVAIPGKDGMIMRSYRFLDLEMPVEYANSWITPVPHFFVRNHMHPPSTLHESTWKLTISGEVEKPLTLTLADLHKLEVHSVTNALECAGNGRGLQAPHVPGIQWQKGAVGNAKFSGPPLHQLLSQAGVKPSAKHVAFVRLDEVPGKVPPFVRSIPIEKAMDADTLVATEMNGSTLTKHHGFPARALVPGWIGAASCKWLLK